MKLSYALAASAALACLATAAHADLTSQVINGSMSSDQTPGVVTQFVSPVVDPGVFTGVMTDVFGQIWDVTVDVLPNSFVVDFATANNPDGNVANCCDLLGIDLSGFTGEPAFGLTNYVCNPTGSFACGAFGPGPSIQALSSTSSTFDVSFNVLRNGETYTFGPAGVPEPATWGLMLVGLGLVGGALRGAKRQAPATA